MSNWENAAKKVSALAVGAMHLPLDVAKYSGMLWNAASNLPEEEIIKRNKSLGSFYDNVEFLPEEVQKYHNWIIKENPEVAKAGEVGLATLLAGPAKGVKAPAHSLLKGSVAKQSADKLSKYLKKVIPVAGFTSAVKASEEYIAEPVLDYELTGNNNDIITAINNTLNQK